ncbi:MAG: NYN domain-containing protein [Nitrospirae bacterium]|nr:NYN domain-containing protein [Nitrospirota bacterium]
MDIVIDGYNVIGSRGGLWGDVAAKREAFVAELARYARVKGHAVTVVFDGVVDEVGKPSLPVAGVRVLFSRGERADDVVIRFSAQLGGRGTIVSSDREVREKCRSHGGVVLGVKDFERRLADALGGGDRPDARSQEGDKKDGGDAEPSRTGSEKRGNPFRLSKTVRRTRKRLERL